MAGKKPSFTRAHVLEMARIHHVLFTLSSLYYGGGGTWKAAPHTGWYAFDDQEGNRFVLAWSKGGLVGLVFHHESDRSEYDLDEDERRPLRWLKDLPARLRPLATKTAADFENLATAGLWSEGKDVILSDPKLRGKTHGLDMIAGLGFPAEDAVFGDALPQSWRELSSLDEDKARLAVRLALASAKKPTRITPADQERILALPGDRKAIDLANAADVKKALAAVGIAWSVPRARILAQHAAKERATEKRVSAALSVDERALFEAARANEPKQVKALLARGVAVDIRTVKGQWEYTPAGDTPLLQACKKSAREAALVLVAGGADPNARNEFGQSGLLWAARSALADVVDACLAAGADPNLADASGEAPLLRAAQCGDAKMVDMLLGAGARKGTKTRAGVTAADRAGMHGHFELARRLKE